MRNRIPDLGNYTVTILRYFCSYYGAALRVSSYNRTKVHKCEKKSWVNHILYWLVGFFS